MLDELTQPHDEAVRPAVFNDAAHDLAIVQVLVVVLEMGVEQELGCTAQFVGKLDNLAWLLNLRAMEPFPHDDPQKFHPNASCILC